MKNNIRSKVVLKLLLKQVIKKYQTEQKLIKYEKPEVAAKERNDVTVKPNTLYMPNLYSTISISRNIAKILQLFMNFQHLIFKNRV